MAGQLKEVRNRIKSVQSTQQITKAMKMVSALEETAEKEPDVKMPDKFKLTSKWIVFI